jgi:DegV family protein with EDD domain
MKKIAVLTDSVSDIPDSLVKKYNIKVVPLYLNFDDRSLKDGIEIDVEEVYSKLKSGKIIKSATPTIEDFTAAYKDLLDEQGFESIYSIHLSSLLSGTINAARSASSQFPEGSIKIIDTKMAAIAEGFFVIEVAKAISRDANEESIDRLISMLSGTISFYATFENFEYIVRGGRAPFLSRFAGKASILKPIIAFNQEGKLSLKKFCFNKKSSIKWLYHLVRKDILDSSNNIARIGICYGNDKGPALELENMVKNDPDISVEEIIMTRMTAIMGAHTGPGIWGISACPVFDPDKP